jgi:hypothetical protein
VYDSRWEASESFVMDRRDQRHVAAWAKNDHLGLEVMYVFGGVVRKYRPDFLIRLTNGTILVLEVKGENTPARRHKAPIPGGMGSGSKCRRWIWPLGERRVVQHGGYPRDSGEARRGGRRRSG